MSRMLTHLFHVLMLSLCYVFLLPLAFVTTIFASSASMKFTSIHFHTSIHSPTDPITIISQTDTIHFPNYVDFTLTASDSANSIDQATLFITFNDTPNSPTEQRDVKINNPASTITLHWREDTSGGNYHSPGTSVQYYWELQDSANHQFIDPPQSFTTIDTRFTWLHLSQGMLQVNWYNRPQAFGQTLLTQANSSLTHISQVLGSGLLHPINLWIYASDLDFHGALAPNSYEWVGGEAHPYLNEAFISVVDSQDTTLVRDMPHELTHLVFHQLIAHGPFAPTWFDEGLAVYNQLYHEPEMKFRFNQALATHTLLRLAQIADGFPADGNAAYLAYAQSWDLIDYMYSTFGQAKMTLLIQKMNTQTAFGDDLTQALGVDQNHLENQWRLHLNQPTLPSSELLTPTPKSTVQLVPPPSAPIDTTSPLFITLGILLIVLPIIGVAALVIYQHRKRQRELALQEAQRILDATLSPRQPYTPLPYNGSGQTFNGPFAQHIPRTPPLEYGRGEQPHNSQPRKSAPQE